MRERLTQKVRDMWRETQADRPRDTDREKPSETGTERGDLRRCQPREPQAAADRGALGTAFAEAGLGRQGREGRWGRGRGRQGGLGGAFLRVAGKPGPSLLGALSRIPASCRPLPRKVRQAGLARVQLRICPQETPPKREENSCRHPGRAPHALLSGPWGGGQCCWHVTPPPGQQQGHPTPRFILGFL